MGALREVGGIDEAGYGPTLGPFVTTCLTAVISPDFQADRFSTLVTGDPSLKITDSKKLFSTGKGLKRLEQVALSLIQTVVQRDITSFSDLITAVTGDSPGNLFSDSPWYSGQDIDLPLSGIQIGFCPASSLKEAGIEGLRIESHVISVPEFNRILGDGFNKGELLLSKVGVMLRWVFSGDTSPSASITVDRLGGRKYYRQFLLEQFAPVDSLRTLLETELVSEYEIQSGRRCLNVKFAVKADADNILTAAASCVSKYIREVSMKLFNDHFRSLYPGINPTQGYPQDAKRFLAEISGSVSDDTVHTLVRMK